MVNSGGEFTVIKDGINTKVLMFFADKLIGEIVYMDVYCFFLLFLHI